MSYKALKRARDKILFSLNFSELTQEKREKLKECLKYVNVQIEDIMSKGF